MPTPRPLSSYLAFLELLLIAPASLFMVSLFAREVQPQQYQPARTAQQIVLWYSDRPWTLGLLLIALPLMGLVAGIVVLVGRWRADEELRAAVARCAAAVRTQFAALVVAFGTFAAAAILAIVFVHALTD